MYIVTIKNGNKSKKIHGYGHKLSSGSVVQGINAIDSFSFSVLPSNPAFKTLHDFTTLVEVFNTNKNRTEFYGRVLCSTPSMSENGLIKKEVTCESFFGFLCDSQQLYVAEKNWTVMGLFQHIIDCHNSMVEEYKHFKIGQVTVTDPNDNLYCGIQRENTFDTIKKKLIDTLGGEIRFRVVNGEIYIDYLERIGETKSTEIALSKNMKAITKEKDPSAYITRLIPLGCKLKETVKKPDGTTEEVETEERLDISSVNGGKKYIDDTQAIEEYGLHVGYVEFDDVTDASSLMRKGEEWLENNNKVLIKYSITALDLSLLGLDIDDFEVHNYHPIKNKLLDIDDTARIIKKTIDICEETKTTIEIGESFKTLSDIQREQYDSLGKINADIAIIKKDYATNEKLSSEIKKTESEISQKEEEIVARVTAGCVTNDEFGSYKQSTAAELGLKVGVDENDRIVSMLNASANVITLNSNRLVINSTNFSLSANGTVKATNAELSGTITANAGKIGGWNITTVFNALYIPSVENGRCGTGMACTQINGDPAFWAGFSGTKHPWNDSTWEGKTKFYVTNDGYVTARSGKIGGWNVGYDGLAANSVGLYSSSSQEIDGLSAIGGTSPIRIYAGGTPSNTTFKGTRTFSYSLTSADGLGFSMIANERICESGNDTVLSMDEISYGDGGPYLYNSSGNIVFDMATSQTDQCSVTYSRSGQYLVITASITKEFLDSLGATRLEISLHMKYKYCTNSNFMVLHDGSLNAYAIRVKQGTIGNLTVLPQYLRYDVSGSSSKAGWMLCTDTNQAYKNVAFAAGYTSNPAGAPFRVYNDGRAFAKDMTITNAAITTGSITNLSFTNCTLSKTYKMYDKDGNLSNQSNDLNTILEFLCKHHMYSE